MVKQNHSKIVIKPDSDSVTTSMVTQSMELNKRREYFFSKAVNKNKAIKYLQKNTILRIQNNKMITNLNKKRNNINSSFQRSSIIAIITLIKLCLVTNTFCSTPQNNYFFRKLVDNLDPLAHYDEIGGMKNAKILFGVKQNSCTVDIINMEKSNSPQLRTSFDLAVLESESGPIAQFQEKLVNGSDAFALNFDSDTNKIYYFIKPLSTDLYLKSVIQVPAGEKIVTFYFRFTSATKGNLFLVGTDTGTMFSFNPGMYTELFMNYPNDGNKSVSTDLIHFTFGGAKLITQIHSMHEIYTSEPTKGNYQIRLLLQKKVGSQILTTIQNIENFHTNIHDLIQGTVKREIQLEIPGPHQYFSMAGAHRPGFIILYNAFSTNPSSKENKFGSGPDYNLVYNKLVFVYSELRKENFQEVQHIITLGDTEDKIIKAITIIGSFNTLFVTLKGDVHQMHYFDKNMSVIPGQQIIYNLIDDAITQGIILDKGITQVTKYRMTDDQWSIVQFNNQDTYLATTECITKNYCMNNPIKNYFGCPMDSYFDSATSTCVQCDSNCFDCTNSDKFCTDCTYTNILNPQNECECKEVFRDPNGECYDISEGFLFNRDTLTVTPCSEQCGVCAYDKDDGPEICFDDLLESLKNEKDLQQECFETYVKESCDTINVNLNTYETHITPTDNLIIDFKSFNLLPKFVKDKLSTMNPEELYDLFIIESDTLKVGKHIKIDIEYNNSSNTIQATIKALKSLKNHYLTIKPVYFHFLPLSELLNYNFEPKTETQVAQMARTLQSTNETDIFNDSEQLNLFIRKLSLTYSFTEITELLNFKLSRAFQPIPINMAQQIQDAAFTENWQFDSTNPNFYFKYTYILGICFFVITLLNVLMYCVGRGIGFQTIDSIVELLMTFWILSMSLEVAGREQDGKLFIVYSMFIGLDKGVNLFDNDTNMLTAQKLVFFSLLLILNIFYFVFKNTSQNSERSKTIFRCFKREKVSRVLRSLQTAHLVTSMYIAVHSVKILNLNSILTKNLFYCTFSLTDCSIIMMLLVNLIMAIWGISSWIWTYKQNIIYMLRNSSYLMFTCSKYGIRFSLVTKAEKVKNIRRLNPPTKKNSMDQDEINKLESMSKASTKAQSRFTTPVFMKKKDKIKPSVNSASFLPELKQVNVSHIRQYLHRVRIESVNSTKDVSPIQSTERQISNQLGSQRLNGRHQSVLEQSKTYTTSRFNPEEIEERKIHKKRQKKFGKLEHSQHRRNSSKRNSNLSNSSRRSKSSRVSIKSRSSVNKRMKHKVYPINFASESSKFKPKKKKKNLPEKKKYQVKVEHQLNVNFTKIHYDHKISDFSCEQEDLLSLFMIGINFECFTINKRINIKNKVGFSNILKAGAFQIFRDHDSLLLCDEKMKNLPLTQKIDLIKQHKLKLQQDHTKCIEKQKQWIIGYNFKIMCARILLIFILSIHSKGQMIQAVFATGITMWLINHTLSIINIGDMSHKGYGMNTWLSIALYVTTIVNYLNLILVTTEQHLNIPIELDVQNWVFLMSIIWSCLTLLNHCYNIIDKLWLRHLFVANQINNGKNKQEIHLYSQNTYTPQMAKLSYYFRQEKYK